MSLGKRLKALRKVRGFKQRDLAKVLGISENTMYRWEADMNAPSDEDKKRLASILGTSIAYLMGETEEPAASKEATVRKDSIRHFDQWIEIPVLDPTAIACAGRGNGGMIEIYASAEKTILLPIDVVGNISIDADKKPFAVLVEGDSMEGAGIPDRSTVVVNPAEEVYDGDVALVCFGLQKEWAIKWVYFDTKDGSVEIRSAAPQYKPRSFTKEEINMGLFYIVGKVTLLTAVPRKGI
ncbi:MULTISPECIES: helix-turn-helix domain-containing protein [Aminobacterium]|jgi:transcriptional regulator with XRE-family HTH domain|uniref:helix-turn-helix domain-containing protein n=1 Tax=Aminobacterium TaxID=81466 RepID=UPI00257E2928|nr:LexA family transcriptional regulator [Aminobacterium sp. UBA4987]